MVLYGANMILLKKSCYPPKYRFVKFDLLINRKIVNRKTVIAHFNEKLKIELKNNLAFVMSFIRYHWIRKIMHNSKIG